MAERERPSRPERFSTGSTLEEVGEFWDTHDFSDYEELCPDVTDQFEIASRRSSIWSPWTQTSSTTPSWRRTSGGSASKRL